MHREFIDFGLLKRKNMKKIIMTAVILASINYAVKAQPGSTTGGFDFDYADEEQISEKNIKKD